MAILWERPPALSLAYLLDDLPVRELRDLDDFSLPLLCLGFLYSTELSDDEESLLELDGERFRLRLLLYFLLFFPLEGRDELLALELFEDSLSTELDRRLLLPRSTSSSRPPEAFGSSVSKSCQSPFPPCL